MTRFGDVLRGAAERPTPPARWAPVDSPTEELPAIPPPRRAAGSHRAPTRRPTQPDEPEPAGDSEQPRSQWQPRAALRRRRQRAKRRRLLEWPVLVVVALLVAVLVRTFVLQSFYIPSGSMFDTLQINNRVVVNKLSYHLHPIHRGDVVVFNRPSNVKISDKDLIKRVIGLPGDVMSGHDGSVYVGSRKLTEPYVKASCHGTADFAPITVPAHEMFVMGDNRCNSYDSRFFGPIPQSLVVGRAFLLIWPLSRFGAL
jgi:signal peptidase I